MLLPSGWAFFFSSFCVLWFPFLLQSQTEAAGKTLILEDKSETVGRNCGFQPPSSFPSFKEQSLTHSDTAAAAQEPPGLCGPPAAAEPCSAQASSRAWVPHFHSPRVATLPHQARATFAVRSTGDAAGAMDMQGKAGTIPAVKRAIGCCYRHAVFPSNFTGRHVCTELSLKMLKIKL